MIFNEDYSALKLQIYIDWFLLLFVLCIIAIVYKFVSPNYRVVDILGFLGGFTIWYVLLIEDYLIFQIDKCTLKVHL